MAETADASGDLDELVRRAREGDRDAYRGIVERCEAGVRVVAAAILPDADAVQDVAQEAFVTAYGRLLQYELGTDFVAWLKTITRNVAMNERTRHLRRIALERRYRSRVRTAVQREEESLLERFEGDLAASLRQCIDGLKTRARDVVKQYYFDDRACPEIAREHGRDGSWARLVLHRARAELSRCLERKGALSRG